MRHSLGLKAALVVTLYDVYEPARGLVVGNTREADRHAGQLVALERSLHLFVEGKVQHAADALPGLGGLLAFAYLTLHLAVTSVVLLWLHQRRPTASPFVRTTLLVASAVALVGFLAYPTLRAEPVVHCPRQSMKSSTKTRPNAFPRGPTYPAPPTI